MYDKEYYEKHKEKVNEKNLRYYYKNRDEILEQRRNRQENLPKEIIEENKAKRRMHYNDNKQEIRARANELRNIRKEQAKKEIIEIVNLDDITVAMERINDKKFENKELHCIKNIKKAKFLIANYYLRKDFELFLEENEITTVTSNVIDDYLMLNHFDFADNGVSEKETKQALKDIYVYKIYEIL